LNQLKLQFLLNDFCLIISSMEMQHYTEQLVLFSSSANLQTQQNLHAHPPPPMTCTHAKSASASMTALHHLLLPREGQRWKQGQPTMN
ncbi:hypothetical protein H0H87_008331, partial [Tephrocybe sp. NHM501043]